MTDQQKSEKTQDQDRTSPPASVPLKSGGEVKVTFLDSPPAAGKKSIHPRRTAPNVPIGEDRTRD
jgi:hypothetical protein